MSEYRHVLENAGGASQGQKEVKKHLRMNVINLNSLMPCII